MLTPDQIERKFEEQRRLLEAIYRNTEKTRKYIFWGKVMSFVYLLLILAPIVLAIIYLPPLIGSAIGPYKELLNSFGPQVGPAGKGAKLEEGFGNLGDLQNFLKSLSSQNLNQEK